MSGTISWICISSCSDTSETSSVVDADAQLKAKVYFAVLSSEDTCVVLVKENRRKCLTGSDDFESPTTENKLSSLLNVRDLF